MGLDAHWEFSSVTGRDRDGRRFLNRLVVPKDETLRASAKATLEQAIAKYVEAVALAVLAEEFKVRTAVVVNQENILVRLWRIAALNRVVGLTRNNNSGHARHTDNLPLAGRNVNK